MGQRLVITVRNSGEDLAKIYYHWSAYTGIALWEASKLAKCIYNHEDETEKELKLRLIRFCEENGGGIDGKPDEMQFIRNMYPNEVFKTEYYSRNKGLIALSPSGMKAMQNYSEGDIYIDIDDECITNGVYGYWDSIEDYNNEVRSWGEEYEDDILKLEDVPDIGYDLGVIDIREIDDVIWALAQAKEHIVRHGNEIYELTE